MHNQQTSSFQTSPSGFAGTPVTSQYRGFQKPYQPVGPVQSQYGQKQAATGWASRPTTGLTSQQSVSGYQSPQAYHTANYRGNQPGHDNSLRADSTRPSQIGMTGMSSFGATGQYGMGQIGTSPYAGASQTFQSPQAYHTANYRGNQPGHDNYLRADSTNPSQSRYAMGYSGAAQSQFQAQSQFASPQSYHTASYRGNQPGHDNSLRADSTQPSSAFSGFGATAGSYRF